MDEIERYEVKAEAFRICTGHMAPGKDPASASYPAPFDERAKAWDEWHATHALPIAAMLTAFERIMERGDD